MIKLLTKIRGNKMNDKLALFEEKEIRKIWKNSKWYFSIIDVVYALTDSLDPKQYLKK